MPPAGGCADACTDGRRYHPKRRAADAGYRHSVPVDGYPLADARAAFTHGTTNHVAIPHGAIGRANAYPTDTHRSTPAYPLRRTRQSGARGAG